MFSSTSLFQMRMTRYPERQQSCVALYVSRVIGVLPTIELQDQPTLATDEISVITSDWFLTDEFETVQLTVTDFVPKR